jgi:hypothetical protein
MSLLLSSWAIVISFLILKYVYTKKRKNKKVGQPEKIENSKFGSSMIQAMNSITPYADGS